VGVHFCIRTTRGGGMMQFGTDTVHNCTRGPDRARMMQKRTPPVLLSMPQLTFADARRRQLSFMIPAMTRGTAKAIAAATATSRSTTPSASGTPPSKSSVSGKPSAAQTTAAGPARA
jgi:hypothetical protein